MASAKYTVQLLLAELYWVANSTCGGHTCVGAREFNVLCNGQLALSAVDIFAAVRPAWRMCCNGMWNLGCVCGLTG